MADSAGIALEPDALGANLDQTLSRLPFEKYNGLSEALYVGAFRRRENEAERARQVELVDQVGQRLGAVVKTPFIYSTRKSFRKPAQLAELAELQDFLRDGFSAFRHMRGAEEFLATNLKRETQIVMRIIFGHPSPFFT